MPDLNGVTVHGCGTGKLVYTPKSAAYANPYAYFALESVPDREYSTTATYVIGDLVKYRATTSDPYKAYRCNTTISTAENWTSAHWTEICVLSQKLSQAAVENEFSELSTYAQKDYATHDGRL